jgi:hypothetical protein
MEYQYYIDQDYHAILIDLIHFHFLNVKFFIKLISEFCFFLQLFTFYNKIIHPC